MSAFLVPKSGSLFFYETFTYHMCFYVGTNKMTVKPMTVTYAITFQAKREFLVDKCAVLIDFRLFAISSCLSFYDTLECLMF